MSFNKPDVVIPINHAHAEIFGIEIADDGITYNLNQQQTRFTVKEVASYYIAHGSLMQITPFQPIKKPIKSMQSAWFMC